MVDLVVDFNAAPWLLTRPECVGPSIDDLMQPQDPMALVQQPGVIFLVAKVDEQPVGYLFGKILSSISLDCHFGFVEGFRGRVALEASIKARDMMFQSGFCKLRAEIPAFNRAALRLAYAIGFRREGVSTGAWLKDGRLQDVVLLGIRRDQWVPSWAPRPV